MKPRVFIGSSTEGLEVAENLNLRLSKDCETVPWNGGAFGISETYIGSLEKALADVEFAVLVVTPDDLREKRGAEGRVPRDNVVFELGLFMGRLGRERTFIVCDPATVELPTDLLGVATAGFDSKRSDGNLRSAVLPAATEILHAIRRAPRLASSRADGPRSNALADPEALYGEIVSWTPRRGDEIVIQTSDTAWAWQILPTLMHWRLNEVAVRVYAPPPPAPGIKARGELARLRLLTELGIELTEGAAFSVAGFFLKTGYPDENVAVVINERARDESSFARKYDGSIDVQAVEALHGILPVRDESLAAASPFVPALVAQDPAEVIDLLRKGVKQYHSPTVGMETATLDTRDLLLMSPYARAYKSVQIGRLLNSYKAANRVPFTALALTLRSGGKSIITPPVVEVRPEGPVVMEGTTRAAYCFNNDIGEYHCIAVKGVEAPLPGTPVKIQAVTISERSLSQRQRTEDYQEPLYRRIERAIHPY